MRQKLKLNPKQVSTLSQILDQTDNQMRELHQKYRPEMTAIHNTQVECVKGMLNDAQRAEYTKMLAEREAKRKTEKK